jgi:leucyl aminopeptidase
MISSEAYRPDDIITSLSGKRSKSSAQTPKAAWCWPTHLTYVQRNYQPRAIIDLATLTGGVVVALGPRAGRDDLEQRRAGPAPAPGRRKDLRAPVAAAAG